MTALPAALDSEAAVVATALSYGQSAIVEAADLRPEEMHSPPHAALWRVVLDLGDKATDPLLVTTALAQAGQSHRIRALVADAIPGSTGDESTAHLAFLGLFVERHATYPGAVAAHASRVRSTAVLRALLELADEVRDQAGKRDADGLAIAEHAEKRLLDLGATSAGEYVRPWRDVLASAIRQIEQRREGAEESPPMSTGFPLLDAVIRGGLRAGKQYVVAGRPGMGKSAFAMALALAAARQGNPVLVFSCEMEPDELGERALASEAGVDLGWEHADRLDANHFLAIWNAAKDMAELHLGIVERPGLTLAEMRRIATRWRLRQAPELRAMPALLVVDYLQLIESEVRSHRGGGDNREQEVAALSRGLRNLARSLGAASLALSQLNRGLESRPEKRPQLSDLRESGAIEQDADVVAMLYRDEIYNPKTQDPGVCEVLIRKQRAGMLARVRLRFVPRYTRFEALQASPQLGIVGNGEDYDDA